MAKGDMTILDMSLDGADRFALIRVNERFDLGVPLKWWHRTDTFRERVRVALRKQWATTCEPNVVAGYADPKDRMKTVTRVLQYSCGDEVCRCGGTKRRGFLDEPKRKEPA